MKDYSDLIARLRSWEALETAGIHGKAADALEELTAPVKSEPVGEVRVSHFAIADSAEPHFIEGKTAAVGTKLYPESRVRELEQQLGFIIKECEASAEQTNRTRRIRARAEAALNGKEVDFASVRDRRDKHINHIKQLSAEKSKLEQQVEMLREALIKVGNEVPYPHHSLITINKALAATEVK